MITGISHVNVLCLDQDSAKAFYTEKLGLDVQVDARMDDGFRWVTVHAPEQPQVQLVLGHVGPPMVSEGNVAQLRELVAMGAFGIGVFNTDDCRAAYEELRAKGVDCIQEPAERPYGVEAVLRDDSGNWFSLTERRAA
jgi:catechol 2,3-dioxygenase-like lactoylglutathione lyase family enzyme